MQKVLLRCGAAVLFLFAKVSILSAQLPGCSAFALQCIEEHGDTGYQDMYSHGNCGTAWWVKCYQEDYCCT